MPKIVLATHNPHKLEEVRSILNKIGIDVVSGDELGLKDVEETGRTFEENALLKAKMAFKQLGIPVLADDSGLCINALQGKPGLYSARFAKEHGGYPAVFDEIWRLMEKSQDRSAYFICTMALVAGNTAQDEHIFTGKMLGKIDTKATGTHLFGYDPIFIPDGYEQSCGVLDIEIKNKISHRAKALEKLVQFLKRNKI